MKKARMKRASRPARRKGGGGEKEGGESGTVGEEAKNCEQESDKPKSS
jgi:hypothetical protein